MFVLGTLVLNRPDLQLRGSYGDEDPKTSVVRGVDLTGVRIHLDRVESLSS